MRPEILYPLFSSLKSLSGIGPKVFQHFKRLCGERVIDLIFHAPSAVQNRRWVESLKYAHPGEMITTYVTVREHVPPSSKWRGRSKSPYRVRCQDQKGYFLDLVFFHVYQDQMLASLPVEGEFLISGRFERYNDRWQMGHPDHIGNLSEKELWIGMLPVYPLTHGLTQKYLQKTIIQALTKVPQLPEWIPEHRLKQNQWLSWRESILKLHNPTDYADISVDSKVRQRLTYDELFANQLALLLLRQKRVNRAGCSFQGSGLLRRKVLNVLPYELTHAQQRALSEINADMHACCKMVRLLQGDVGSGKTVVAMLSMLNVIECGAQAVLLAPTEILAQQHIETLKPWAQAANITMELLTSHHKGKKDIYARLASGETQIAVGTHALLQDVVEFKDLGLIVIDEQHRFGVEQRLKLSAKGKDADILVMTATPIPRTLMLAHYGDLDTSYLDEKPRGRKDIITRTTSLERIEEVIQGVTRALKEGKKLYWICPLVEESETLDLVAAEDRFHMLKKLFPGKVGLVHGRMKSNEKEAVMEQFVKGDLRLLVATTVIEVGVNVTDATIMVIEHAERFGLSQLHQLRGRIGRGEEQSTCLLLYGKNLTQTAKARLKIMRETNNGFLLAEEDLRLRGGGEALGWRQSGIPNLKVAEFEDVQSWLTAAHEDAEELLKQDPKLESIQGKAARILLYLYEKDKEAQNLMSG